MKHAFLFFIAMSFMACTEEETKEVKDLKSEREMLKSKSDSIKKRIAEIDLALAVADSSFVDNRVLISYSELRDTTFAHFFEIYGEVETDKNVMLYPEMAGLIKSIKVKEGQRVSKGQSLVDIDSEIIRNQINEVQTAYDLANTTFEKQERLWKKNIGSELQYLQAKNRKESLEASLGTLNSQLSKALVRAPFSGTVDEIFPNVGEMANPAMPLIRLVNMDKLYLTCEVSEQHLRAVKKGTPVKVEIDNTGQILDSKVAEVSSFINPENRSFKVKINLPKADGLKPNLMSKVIIKDHEVPSSIVVRSSSILQSQDGKDFVYTLEEKDSKLYAVKNEVVLGKEYKGNVHVIEGLASGMKIIEEGSRSVRHQQEVRIY
ncbi:MAG: efflux RND transporter periplasmic adaptor subunit [Flavobacteriales bacterium]|nr:efflux RND transporter periplasmic adaptor subunit [Flavobacteriales bacterium]